MRFFTQILLVPVALTLLSAATKSVQAYPHAQLSWDKAGTLADLAAPPPDTTLRLYLTLTDAVDVRRIYLTLAWVPAEAYVVIPASFDSTCGWISPIPPASLSYPDSTYNTTIQTMSPTAPSCITANVVARACTTGAATFTGRVLLYDSAGSLTYLTVDCATLAGGLLGVCPMSFPPITTTVDTTALQDVLSRCKALLPGPPGIPPGLRNSAVHPVIHNELEFTLSRDQLIRLTAHDVAGRIIGQEAKQFSAGTHRLEWPSQNVSSRGIAPGVYFIRLRCPEFTRSATVVVR